MYRILKKFFFIVSIISLNLSLVAKHSGAGVLPYAFDPKTKKVYFLFSKEAFGKDRNKWADFGGSVERKDKNSRSATASREFYEESIGLFGSRKIICDHLRNKKNLNVYRIGKSYSLYFVQVKFNKDINKKFLKRRSKAKNFKQLEKKELQWVSAKRLIYALEHNQRSIILSNGKKINLRGCTYKFLRSALHLINELRGPGMDKGSVL